MRAGTAAEVPLEIQRVSRVVPEQHVAAEIRVCVASNMSSADFVTHVQRTLKRRISCYVGSAVYVDSRVHRCDGNVPESRRTQSKVRERCSDGPTSQGHVFMYCHFSIDRRRKMQIMAVRWRYHQVGGLCANPALGQ